MVEDRNIGRVLDGKYELISLIGAGGMGGVYEAHHHLIGRRLAVKLLHAEYARDDNVVQRFRREATNTSAVGHENIVEITDMGVTDTGELYLVMEYLDGRDLASVLEEVGRTSQGWACYIISQVLSALEATHAAGIIHRDLKPANVFLTARPETESFVKIVDFGISKVRADEQGVTKGLTRTGELLGTPQYMSSEQARGLAGITAATDIYSAGVILYEMLTGQQPYTGKTYAEILFKILAEEAPDPALFRPDLHPGLLAAIRTAMASDPAQRFPSASAFLAAVGPYADSNAPIAGGPPSVAPPQIAPRHPASRPPSASTADGIRLSTTPLALSGDVTVTPQKRRLWIPVLAVTGGLAVVAALAAWFALSSSTQIAPPVVPLPIAPSASAEPTAGSSTSAGATAGSSLSTAGKAVLTVQVTPATATVTLDGKGLGRGSGSYEVIADGEQHTLEIAAEGWSTASRVISLERDLTVMIDLKREGKGKGKSKDRDADEDEMSAVEPAPPPEPTLVLVPKPPPEPTPPPEPEPDPPPKKADKPKEKEPAEEQGFKRKIDHDDPW